MKQYIVLQIFSTILLLMCIACSDFSGSDVTDIEVNEHLPTNNPNLILEQSTNATATVTALKSYSTETEVGFRYPSSGSEGNSTAMIIEVDDDGTHFSDYKLNFSGGVD